MPHIHALTFILTFILTCIIPYLFGLQHSWLPMHNCYNHNCFRLERAPVSAKNKCSCAAPMHPRSQTSLLMLMCCVVGLHPCRFQTSLLILMCCPSLHHSFSRPSSSRCNPWNFSNRSKAHRFPRWGAKFGLPSWIVSRRLA